MARPKPDIMLEIVDKNYNTEQILDAEAIYAVYHEDKPINLRTMNTLVNYPGPKYKKVSFSNPGHAFNLAQKLNVTFKTNLFEVYDNHLLFYKLLHRKIFLLINYLYHHLANIISIPLYNLNILFYINLLHTIYF